MSRVVNGIGVSTVVQKNEKKKKNRMEYSRGEDI
jgi:hypothetical protein